jgi:hypothetical protein
MRVLRALYPLVKAISVRDLADLLKDEYNAIYNTLNDMSIPSKNRGEVLTVRGADKTWSLTAAGRKEAERLVAAPSV